VLWIVAGVSLALLIYEGNTLIGSVLWPLWNNPNALQTDFHYYYEAALRFRGDASRLYSATDDVIAGFAYPPPAIVPFVWLSYLPLGPALLVFTIASYAAVLGAMALWFRYLRQHGLPLDARARAALTLIALALAPTYMNAIFGQVNAFVLLCGVAFVALAVERPGSAGGLLAAGIWLKIYPALLVAAGAWERRTWRAIAIALVGFVVVVLVLLPIVPEGAYDTYLDEVLPARFDKTAIHITNQSLAAFVERFSYPPERFLHWTGEQAVTTTAPVRATNVILGAAVMGYLWWRARTNGPLMSMAGVIALAAIIAPLGWGHTFVLVLPLVVLHLATIDHVPAPRQAMVLAAVAALMIPAGRHLPIDWLPASVQNLVYSRYLLATIALMMLPVGRSEDRPYG
jgi:hypothetical protein